MNEEVFIVAIVFGSVITVVSIIAGIIKTKIKQGSGSSMVSDENFLEALRHFKEKTDRRLSKLEEAQFGRKQDAHPGVKNSSDRLQIEMDEPGEGRGNKESSGNLRNMLKE